MARDIAKDEPSASEKKDAGVEIKPNPAAKAEKPTGDPSSYTAPHDVYTGGRYVKSGDPIVTNEKPGKDWVKVGAKALAAIEASTNPVPADPPLESLDLSALQAVAVTKHVNPTGLDKAALITAIKAAYEPAL